MKKLEKNLEKQANDILKIARQYGLEQSFFFATTFEKYITQMEILKNLKKGILSGGVQQGCGFVE
jgi:hypothetical protein